VFSGKNAIKKNVEEKTFYLPKAGYQKSAITSVSFTMATSKERILDIRYLSTLHMIIFR